MRGLLTKSQRLFQAFPLGNNKLNDFIYIKTMGNFNTVQGLFVLVLASLPSFSFWTSLWPELGLVPRPVSLLDYPYCGKNTGFFC